MKALVLNCTLKPSPEKSITQQLADVVTTQLRELDVEVSCERVVDQRVLPGVNDQMGPDDDWPALSDAVMASDVLVIATPTWVGHPSSVAQRVLERMDSLISQTRPDGEPVVWGKVAGVVVTGNEDGAHHVISEVSGGLVDIGFTIPGQAWTYWNMGPGPGPSYGDTDHGIEWSRNTGITMANHLHAVATALADLRVDSSSASS
ncbi:MAG: flavodoxin family protein [Actinomycetota bacterium]